MTPNVARLLRKYGIDKAIGDSLVRFEELNLRRWEDGRRLGYAPLRRVERTLGQPWWLVHRHHLHTGLVDVARERGVDIQIGARVTRIEYENTPRRRVEVETARGKQYAFDLLVGADGLSSIVRRTVFPGVRPLPPNGNLSLIHI